MKPTDSRATQAAATKKAKINNRLRSCVRACARRRSWGVTTIASQASKIEIMAKLSQTVIAFIGRLHRGDKTKYTAVAATTLMVNRRRESPEIQCRIDMNRLRSLHAATK